MPDSNPKLAHYLNLALQQARKGLGLTSPNPPVGAVVTDPDGNVIGAGYHREAGGPHAEVEAIADAERSHGTGACRGGSIYVTLEPCSTHGKTPPCCDAIRDAGIKHVVWGAEDPNPIHAGAAMKTLNDYSIDSGVADQEIPEAVQCRALIAPFLKWVTEKLPWVIAKAGTTLDGRIARPPGESQWITSEASREDAHFLRSEVDAIIVGANTVRVDNPSLTVRGRAESSEKIQPWRVVLTKSGVLPEQSNLFSDSHKNRTIVYKDRPLRSVLSDLASRGCLSVLIEGGAEILGQFFGEGLVDEACFYVAPRVCGGGPLAVGTSTYVDGAASWVLNDPVISVLDGNNVRVRGMVVQSSKD